MRVLLFSERLRPPLDEGFKNTAINLLRVLRRQHNVLALTTRGEDMPAEGVRNLPANKLFTNREVATAIAAFAPQVVLYLPTASATPAAMLRTRVLQRRAAGAAVAMLALQPRRYDALTRAAIRLIHPRLIIAQSDEMARRLAATGCRVTTMRSGVDAARFTPATAGEQAALRRELGLPLDAFIVLHVGHINANRNVQSLARLQQAGCQAVLVGSTSTPQDDDLARRLQEQGVIVVRTHVSDIASYYRAAGCYVFPVLSGEGAIALPLSVLEAMACNLPVVSTPFGDLPTLFPASSGISYAAGEDTLVSAVVAMRSRGDPQTRRLVQPFSWDVVAQGIMDKVLTGDAELTRDAKVVRK